MAPSFERSETFEKTGESIEKKKKRGGIEQGGRIDRHEPTSGFAKLAPSIKISKKYCPQILFIFRGVYSPEAQQLFIDAQYTDAADACECLGVTAHTAPKDLKLFVLVFDSQEKKKSADPFHAGSRASARFNEMELYRYWRADEDPHFPHELTHLIAHVWGESYSWVAGQHATLMMSTSFFQEGLALAVDEFCFKRQWVRGKFLDELCREYAADLAAIHSLEQCVNFDGMNTFQDTVIMPFAGSFVKFLIQEFGMDTFKNIYTHTQEILSPWENIAEVEKICGMSEKELLRRWREKIFIV